MKDNYELLKYDKIFKDQESKGIIEEISLNTEASLAHYLPHHPVLTLAKTTTKVRIVYNASSKVRKELKSLNDCLYRCPVSMPNLCGVLLRFRMHQVAIVADIQKAFLPISLNKADRDVTRFLWIKDLTKEIQISNLKIYRFQRVAFGVISSPFPLTATVAHHSKEEEEEECRQGRERQANIIKDSLNDMYVDNFISGTKDVQRATENYEIIKNVFERASMNLKDWRLNSRGFKKQLNKTDCSKGNSIKILGLIRQKGKKILNIHLDDSSISSNTLVNERQIQQRLAKNHDPLGLLPSAILPSKLPVQNIWHRRYNWDQPVPTEINLS